MQTQTTQTTQTKPVVMCDRPGCTAEAIAEYEWAWGEKGTCCAHHQMLLRQNAAQIKRTITFSRVQGALPNPMSRDERTQLKAQVYSLQEELAEAKLRCAELYRSNTELATQLRAANLRQTQLDGNIGELELALQQGRLLYQELERRLVLSDDELQTLRTIVERPEPLTPSPSES